MRRSMNFESLENRYAPSSAIPTEPAVVPAEPAHEPFEDVLDIVAYAVACHARE